MWWFHIWYLVFGPSNRAVLNPSGCYIATRGVRLKGLSVFNTVHLLILPSPTVMGRAHSGYIAQNKENRLEYISGIFLCFPCGCVSEWWGSSLHHLFRIFAEYWQWRQTELFIAQFAATKLWLPPGSVASSIFTITVYTLQVCKSAISHWETVGSTPV